MSMEQRLFSTTETARYLGVSDQTILNMVADGRLSKPIYIGRKPMYDRADLDEFIASRKAAANS